MNARALVGEALGTAFLLACVVGSGIMAERLSGGNAAVALLANALATGGILVALILTFGSVSGAHFNPAVTLSFALEKAFPWSMVPGYILAQIAGAFAAFPCSSPPGTIGEAPLRCSANSWPPLDC